MKAQAMLILIMGLVLTVSCNNAARRERGMGISDNCSNKETKSESSPIYAAAAYTLATDDTRITIQRVDNERLSRLSLEIIQSGTVSQFKLWPP